MLIDSLHRSPVLSVAKTAFLRRILKDRGNVYAVAITARATGKLN
jgi:hypothetical protein